MLAWPSGEDYAAERLPRNAYRKYIRAALRGGMEAVAQITPFAETLQRQLEWYDRYGVSDVFSHLAAPLT